MKKTILNFALIALMIIGASSCKEKAKEDSVAETSEMATGETGSFDVDVAASSIMWKGSKPLGSHHGTVNLANGSFTLADGKMTDGKFMIDMKSITDLSGEGQMKENLEAHLKGTAEGKEGDFFNTTEYPFATFILKGISEVDGKMIANGNLTIKDKTNPVEFAVSLYSDANKMTMKSETFKIDRTKWGVNYGSKTVFDNLGDKFIDDEMELTISVVGNKS